MIRTPAALAATLVLALGCGRKSAESEDAPATPGGSDTRPTARATPPTARERPAPTGERPRAGADAAAAATARDRLKQIGKGIHEYESATYSFPAGIAPPAGKVGLSWRVMLLLYIGEEKLFGRFKLDEPWDGPTNKALLVPTPKVFESPGRPAPDGHTYLRSFIGHHAFIPAPVPGAPQIPPGRFLPGRRIVEIIDGTSNTLMVAEAAEAVPWTKADDLPFPGYLASGPIPVPKLGGVFADGFHGLMCDGEVRFFPATLGDAAFRRIITHNGNDEPFPPDLEKAVYPSGRPRPGPYVPSEKSK